MRSVVAVLALGCGGSNDDGPTTPGANLPVPDCTGCETGSSVADAVGNSLDTAQAVSVSNYYLDATVVAEETIFPAGDRDFYVLDGAAGSGGVPGTVWQFYTSSWQLNGQQVILDSVLRVYDEAGNMVAENDDMPYRFWETDSAIWVQQTWNGPIYVEVLEWSDWEGLDPLGGPDFTYELYAAIVPELEATPNDSVEDAIEAYDSVDPDDDVTTNDYQPYWQSLYALDLAIEMMGRVADGDEDYWAFETADDSQGAVWQWSLWPHAQGDLDIEMTLYSDAGEVLAQTSGASAEVEPDYPFLYDAGITYPVNASTKYVMGVRNLAADSANSAYIALNTGYIADVAGVEIEPNNAVGTATQMEMEESTSLTDYWFGRTIGDLASGDAADVLLIDNDVVGDVDGAYLSVQIHALEAGSFLDAEIEVEGSISGTITTLTNSTENGEDPELIDFKLSSNEDLYIHIRAQSNTADPKQNLWFALVSVSPTPSE